MGPPEAEVLFAPELRFFLAPPHRDGQVTVTCDGTSTLGHMVESLGVPLPETGDLTVNGEPTTAACRLKPGDAAEITPVTRPQRVRDVRFVLDVHLGTLARRLRLLGIDTAYANDRDDPELVEQANAEHRVLLTQDRGLLHRRKLWLGAYVRGSRPDDQLRDVLGRFDPPLAPWTRCPACNGTLASVPKAEVERQLQPGTRRTIDDYARCVSCARVYWRGAHNDRLTAIIETAVRASRSPDT
jgi:uncharacterized protein with PIN domain